MTDSNLPPPTASFLVRVGLLFLAAFVTALVVLHLAGCASAPPPLTVAIDVSNGVADELTALVAANDRAIRSEAVRAEKGCVVTDRPCRQTAIRGAIDAHAKDSMALLGLGLSQRMAADALDVAKKCKAAGDDKCLAASVQDALDLLSELRAGVAAYHKEHP